MEATLKSITYNRTYYLYEFIINVFDSTIEGDPLKIELINSETDEEFELTLETVDELIDVLNDFKTHYNKVKNINISKHG